MMGKGYSERTTAGGKSADELAIRQHLHQTPAVQGLVRFDTFTGKAVLQRPVPRPYMVAPPGFLPRTWQDYDTTAMCEYLIGAKFRKVRRGTIDHVMMLEASSNPYSSAVERLAELAKWDGRPRMEDHLIEVLGLVDESKFDFYRSVSRCFFKSIVARVMRPGCKVDNMLMLEGPQGIRKSQLLRVWALDDDWFSDNLPHNLGSKDAKLHLLGKLVVEMSEIAQMDRTSTAALKQFLSMQDGEFRPPYARHEVKWPRQCVFVGTTNDDTYLRDTTGNRRYWPITCGMIDLDFARETIEQVFAEAIVDFEQNPVWWFENGENEIAEKEQSERVEVDPWEDKARKEIAALERNAVAHQEIEFDVVVDDVLQGWYGLVLEKQEPKHFSRVGKILKSLGGIRRRIVIEGRQRTVRRFKIGG